MEFRRAHPGELHTAIGLILSADRPAGSTQISEFLHSAAERRIDPAETWVAAKGDNIVFAALPVVSPGRTILILVPGEISHAAVNGASRLVNELCARYAGQGVHLAQVLLDPERMETRKFYESHAFAEMAELIYLHGYAPRLAAAPSLGSQMSWKHYDASTHDLFSRGILASYQKSLDCPALNGMRHIEDVIAGHKATGEFDPSLWSVLCEGDAAHGVMLLNRIPLSDSLELTYLGLAPEARGRGLADICLREAYHQVVQDHRRRLTLAVDSGNQPALKLYYRHGMQRIACKVALMRDLRKTDGA